jgi:hypothetical protein
MFRFNVGDTPAQQSAPAPIQLPAAVPVPEVQQLPGSPELQQGAESDDLARERFAEKERKQLKGRVSLTQLLRDQSPRERVPLAKMKVAPTSAVRPG